MTGPEHYAAAEQIAAEAERSGDEVDPAFVFRGLIHATLAVAAATALKNVTDVVSPGPACRIAESWRATVMGSPEGGDAA